MIRLGVLTGGGDVPGLNSCIKGLVQGATERGMSVLGLRSGWQGILELDAKDAASRSLWTLELTRDNTRTIDRSGGTFLHSSRTNPAKVKGKSGEYTDCTKQVLDNLAALGVDVLVPIGGDDTLSFGARLHRLGFPVVAVPKTMDNDVYGTDYCLGFSTAVTRAIEYIHQLRTCAGSHERFLVVELFGRNSGETSLISGYLSGADRVLIAEVPFDGDRLAAGLSEDRRKNPSGYAVVTISEGATLAGGEVLESGVADAYGHKKLGGIGEMTSELLKKKTGVGTIFQNLGYLVRSGPPDAVDLMVTFNYAHLALELVAKKTFGQLVCLRDGRYGHVPLSIVGEGQKRVPIDELYDPEAYRVRIRSVLGMPMYLR